MPDHHDHDHRPTIFHTTAPLCAWSWGYEPVLNRIRMVYGDQVPIHLLYQSVYDSVDEWFENYEMTEAEYLEWNAEIAETIGLPLNVEMPKASWAPSSTPATLAVLAAQLQSPTKAERLSRAFMRRYLVGGEDVTRETLLLECVKEAGLDVAAFTRAWKDQDSLKHALEHQGEGVHWPHVSLNFYNLVVSDGHRHVVLEHAFDPAIVEDAVDWLGGGALKKRAPTDVGAYLAAHGPTPKEEIAKAFAWEVGAAEKALTDLEKKGKAMPIVVNGATFWKPK